MIPDMEKTKSFIQIVKGKIYCGHEWEEEKERRRERKKRVRDSVLLKKVVLASVKNSAVGQILEAQRQLIHLGRNPHK